MQHHRPVETAEVFGNLMENLLITRFWMNPGWIANIIAFPRRWVTRTRPLVSYPGEPSELLSIWNSINPSTLTQRCYIVRSRSLVTWPLRQVFSIPTATKAEKRDFMLDQRVDDSPSSAPDPAHQVRSEYSGSSMPPVGAQSTIGKTLLIKGKITGSGSVKIEGQVEGSIELPDDRVTVGRNGRVSASIAAQDIVVFGEVLGNCKATDHLDIRSEASICGDVVVSRISIEEGAYLTGGIEIRREAKAVPRADEHKLVESLHVN